MRDCPRVVLVVDDPSQKDDLKRLDEKIRSAKEAYAPKPRQDDEVTQAQLVWRMVIELVAGIVIGFGIGYGLDNLFGTIPIFLVLFTLLGFAAGVKTMLRSAKELQVGDAAEAGKEKRE